MALRALTLTIITGLLGLFLAGAALAAPADPEPRAVRYAPATLADEGTWNRQASGVNRTLRGVSFVSNLTGWAVGGERDDDCLILHTRDGGKKWEPQSCPRARRLDDVDFVDRNVGWAVGLDGTIVHTTDGGASWVRQWSGTNTSLTAISAWDANLAWVALRSGEILKTVDGGNDWKRINFGNGNGLFDIDFVDPGNGWIVGSAGTMMRTIDGGESWFQLDFPWDDRFLAVDFVNLDLGWTAGNGLKHSKNGGASWRSQDRGENEIDKTLEDIDMTDGVYGWAIGDEGTIIRTTDSGERWVPDAEGMTTRGLRAVDFIDRYEGWVVGTGGRIYHYYAPRPVPPTALPPTALPPTATFTPTPMPTATHTPMPTATPTPSGPWLSAGDPDVPLLAAPGGSTRVLVTHGNIPVPTVLTATLTGDVRFNMVGVTGRQTFTDTVLVSDDRWYLVVRGDDDALPGASFDLSVEVDGAAATKEGVIAYDVFMPIARRGW